MGGGEIGTADLYQKEGEVGKAVTIGLLYY